MWCFNPSCWQKRGPGFANKSQNYFHGSDEQYMNKAFKTYLLKMDFRHEKYNITLPKDYNKPI